MKCCEEAGRIYDFGAYCMFFFNYDTIRARLALLVRGRETVDSLLENYEALLASAPPPPGELYPFFYYDGVNRSVFLSYLLQVCFGDFSMPFAQCSQLLKDSEIFRRFFFRYYWEPVREQVDFESFLALDPESAALFVRYSSYSPEVTDRLLRVLFHFDELYGHLLEYLERVLPSVVSLRDRVRERIALAEEEYQTVRTENLLRSRFGLSWNVGIPVEEFTVSAIHPRAIDCRADDSGHARYVLCAGGLEDWIYLHPGETAASSNLAYLFHPLKHQILQELKQHPSTASQLSEKLHVSRTTMARQMKDLDDALFIRVSRRNGNEIFYELNTDYLLAVAHRAEISLQKLV